MKNSSCNFCGSSRLKADRALSGRIICMDCGRPIGLNSYSGRNTKSNKNDKAIVFVLILVSVILIIRCSSML